ncbi:MAG: CotH kinase family protein, partial [Phycisphaerae bacterium]|nr:CotH kinase family protein [Phycisphaerae bacterium]
MATRGSSIDGKVVGVRTHADRFGRTSLATAMVLMALCAAQTALAVNPVPNGNSEFDDASTHVFLDGEVTFIYVTMDPADLLDCLNDPWSDELKPCTVHIVNSAIDEIITDVGIRPRGNTSRDSIKKSWKLDFNDLVPDRQFHELESLNINGEHNDVSITRSKLAWDLYKRMGVPSPRATHVQIKINDGTYVEGVHVCVEQIDEELAENWFGNKDGNLYKCRYQGARADLRYVAPGTPETYQNLGGGETYEEHNNDPNSDFTDLANFIDFINNTDDAAFAAGIVQRFSVDNFLRAMAVDVTMGHWDNYWYGANNYYLYHNEDTDRFEYIPYDLDNTYGVDFFGIDWANRGYANWGNGGFGSDNGQLPPLIERILDIPAYEAQYRRYLRQLVGAVGQTEYSTVTYNDTVGDLFSGLGPHYDIVSVDVSNDASNLYVTIQLNGPVDVGGDTGNGEYMIFFDTKPGGSTSNPWGRLINATVAHDYFIGSWPDGGGGLQLWEYGSSWHQPDDGASIDLTDKANGRISYIIPLDDLGLEADDEFDFDVVSTGGGSDPGVDHLSNPSISTPDWSTPSTPGTYLSYTVQDSTPPASVDGPFTLACVEAGIDQIYAMITPYAFEGSYDNGNMDWSYTTDNFLDSYTYPTTYRNWGWGWDWGLKPYIDARTSYLRLNVPAPADLPRLYINEMLAGNNTINTDELGQYEDWVEIYNDGDTAVDVGGMYLTDDPGNPTQWQIPAGTSIAAKGWLLVWCDDDAGDGPLHASFKLSGDGEGVGLYHTDTNGNVLIDFATYPAIRDDVSCGRYPDGADDWGFMATPTPAAANAPHNNPPMIENTAHAPLAPTAVDTVVVTAAVTDDGSVTSVTLTYDAGAGAQVVTMYDDGAHGDGAAGD